MADPLRAFVPRAGGRPGPPGTARTARGTVLSADLTGFTALSDRLAELGPETLRRRLDAALTPVVRAVIDAGGDLISIAGDGLTAVFSDDDAPGRTSSPQGDSSGGDSSQRGGESPTGWVRANACVARLRSWSTHSALPVRLGIAAGDVTVALLGDPSTRLQVLALGPPVRAATAAQRRDDTKGCPSAGLPPVAGVEWTRDLRPFLPRRVGDRLISARAQLLAELRPVTAVFVRMDAELADPGQLHRLQAAFCRVAAAVAHAGGDVRHVEHDDVGLVAVALFGATRTFADAEARAVRMALDLLDEPDLSAAAIAHGPAFCGVLGPARRREWATVGSALNRAARMLNLADGGVVVDESTARRLDPSARGVRRAVALRGFAEPVGTYRVVAAPGPARPQPRATVVGRGRERAVLRSAWRRSREVGRCVVLVGAPGIGKSILLSTVSVYAADRAAADRPSRVGAAVEWDGTRGMASWRPLLGDLLGLAPKDGAAGITPALTRVGVTAAVPRVPLLAPLLGLAVDDTALTTRLDQASRSALLARLVTDVVAAAARETRLLLGFEDVHLADDGSRALLVALARARIPGVLTVVTGQPGAAVSDLVAALGPGRVARIDVARLDATAARTLAHRHLRAAGVQAPSAVDSVLRTAEGNPLYLEHGSYVAARGEVPARLERVLAARVDDLAEVERATLTVASIVGPSFDADTVQRVLPTLGDLDVVTSTLDRLTESGLVRATDAGGTYRFAHAASRDAVYGIAARAVRRELHRRVAEHLSTRPDREAAEVAHHFLLGGDRTGQRVWFGRAGRAQRAQWDLIGAGQWFVRARAVATGAELGDVRLALAEIDTMTGHPRRAAAGFRTVLRDSASTPAQRAASTQGLGELALAGRGTTAAVELLEQAVASWTLIGDDGSLLAALDRLSFAQHRAGKAVDAGTTARRQMELARRRHDTAALAAAYDTAGLIAFTLGELDGAAVQLAESLRLARECGDLRAVVHSANDAAGVELDRAHATTALGLLVEAEKVAESIGYETARVKLLANRGEILRRAGRYGLARRYLSQATAAELDAGELADAVKNLGNIGLVELAAGREREARSLLRAAVHGAELTGQSQDADEFRMGLRRLDDPTSTSGPDRVDAASAMLDRRLAADLALSDTAAGSGPTGPEPPAVSVLLRRVRVAINARSRARRDG